MIPKVIYMTYKNKNIPVKYLTQWKKLNPDYEIKFYTDKDCIKFLNDNFGKEYADFFKWIKKGPHKADFWRYCILYKYGGVYVDIDLVPYVSIPKIIDNSNFCTCIGIDNESIFQAFIATTPNNIFLKKSIDSLMNKKQFVNFWDVYNNLTIDMYNVTCKILNTSKLYANNYYYLKYNDKDNIMFYKIKFLDEIKLKNGSENCFVKFKNKLLFRSRDPFYYYLHKKKNKYLNKKFNYF